jgi:hypothetical protein
MRKINKIFIGYILGIIAAYATMAVDTKLGIWEFIGYNSSKIGRVSNALFIVIMVAMGVVIGIIGSKTKDSYDVERELEEEP